MDENAKYVLIDKEGSYMRSSYAKTHGGLKIRLYTVSCLNEAEVFNTYQLISMGRETSLNAYIKLRAKETRTVTLVGGPIG